MRALKRIYLAVLGGALLVGGCQLIAGVHDDAVLDDDADGGTDGGSDGGAPCMQSADCHGFGVCFEGHCCNEVQSQETVCAGRCGNVADVCGRTFECDQCVAPATCGPDNTCK